MGIGCLVYNTFHVGYVFGACLEVVIWRYFKNILYGYIEGQTDFGISGGAKSVSGRTEVGFVSICADSNTTFELASRVEERIY